MRGRRDGKHPNTTLLRAAQEAWRHSKPGQRSREDRVTGSLWGPGASGTPQLAFWGLPSTSSSPGPFRAGCFWKQLVPNQRPEG